jgi:hypothetical protein
MRRYLSLSSVCAVFLALVCLPALADSHDSFSNEKLGGSSGSTVSGSFTFNSTTDTFSNISLSFNSGAFNGINASDASGGKATCILGLCAFSWKTEVGNVWVWDTIILNTNPGASYGQYWDIGKIVNWQNSWNFDPLPAPEGGTSMAYVALSGIAMVAGILISRKKTRTARIAPSI